MLEFSIDPDVRGFALYVRGFDQYSKTIVRGFALYVRSFALYVRSFDKYNKTTIHMFVIMFVFLISNILLKYSNQSSCSTDEKKLSRAKIRSEFVSLFQNFRARNI
ncbi:hypothetical protein QQ045_003051 [Rhodiola kirilowii]